MNLTDSIAPRSSGRIQPLHLVAWIGVLLLPCLLAGCRSGKDPRSSAMASVLVSSGTTEEIRQTTRSVFTENLYRIGVSNSPASLVFERPGSTMDEIKYGGFFENNIWVRVKVTISRFGDMDHLLEADAFIVRNHDEGFFEDEQKLYRISKGQYQKMLEEVRKRVDAAAEVKARESAP